MNEKDNEILELTELLEEDFEEMEGVEDFAPEEAFDVEELDSELDQMLHENGQKSGVRDDDINLDALFDEEEEGLDAPEQEENIPAQDSPDTQEALDIDLELIDEDEQEQDTKQPEAVQEKVVQETITNAAPKPDLPQQTKDIDDLPEEEPVEVAPEIPETTAQPAVETKPETDEPEKPEPAEEVTAPPAESEVVADLRQEIASLQETVTALKAESAEEVTAPTAENEVVANLRQEIANLQETVTTLKAELDQLRSGLGKKIQTEIQTNLPKTEGTDQSQKLQEQCKNLESSLQKLNTDVTARFQQLESQQADSKQDTLTEIQQKQDKLQTRLVVLEAKTKEKIDVEALQADLQKFITKKIPATVANMLREEIAALTQQLGK